MRVTTVHVVTYFFVGLVAALLIDYESLFARPVIRDYMRDFGSVALFAGPVVQLVRGLIVAAVLVPFRSVLAQRRGWLWLWLLLIGVGILSTSAAAPSSIEGVVYTRLPLWYHGLGLPEILAQTLLFSVVVGFYARHPRGLLASLPPVAERIVGAIATAAFAFVAYAVVSVAFAIAAGAVVNAEQNLSLEVQGVFVIPFFANATIAFVATRHQSSQSRLTAALLSYAIGATAIFGYQWAVSGAPDLLYPLVAPVAPALVLWLSLRLGHRPAPATNAAAATEP